MELHVEGGAREALPVADAATRASGSGRQDASPHCRAQGLPGTATGKFNNALGIVHLHGTRENGQTKKALRREPFFRKDYISKGSMPRTG